jgi:hypothetical protein
MSRWAVTITPSASGDPAAWLARGGQALSSSERIVDPIHHQLSASRCVCKRDATDSDHPCAKTSGGFRTEFLTIDRGSFSGAYIDINKFSICDVFAVGACLFGRSSVSC